MKSALRSTLLLVCLAALVVGQQPAMQQSAVKMSGRNISLQYTPAPRGAKIAGLPCFFHTDANLEIQGLSVPKGDYSFYVLPEGNEWQLIISKQTGAQAVVYNQKMDLGRVPMDMKRAATPAAALQMKLSSLGSIAGKLELSWENSIASVPFNIDAVKANAEW